jgi:hypothetical protein
MRSLEGIRPGVTRLCEAIWDALGSPKLCSGRYHSWYHEAVPVAGSIHLSFGGWPRHPARSVRYFRAGARDASVQPERLEPSTLQVPIEDRIDVLEHIGGHLHEAALVLDRYERSFGTVVHRNL